MIFVDRSQVPQPRWFGSSEWHDLMIELVDHRFARASSRAQVRASTLVDLWPAEVVEALWQLFDGCCAICESPVREKGPQAVKRFRPLEVEEAGSIEERVSHTYAALLWENLLLMCSDCDKARGDRFPLQSSWSPSFHAHDKKLESVVGMIDGEYILRTLHEFLKTARAWEQPLLIDPTFDQPLYFLGLSSRDRGFIKPLGRDKRKGRAIVTIQTFELNRLPLREERTGAVRAMRRSLQDFVPQFKRAAEASPLFNSFGNPLRQALKSGQESFPSSRAGEMAAWFQDRSKEYLQQLLLRPLSLGENDLSFSRKVLLPLAQADLGSFPDVHAYRQVSEPWHWSEAIATAYPIWMRCLITSDGEPLPVAQSVETPLAAKSTPRKDAEQSEEKAAAKKALPKAGILGKGRITLPSRFGRLRVTKIRLRNFRQFDDVTIELPEKRFQDPPKDEPQQGEEDQVRSELFQARRTAGDSGEAAGLSIPEPDQYGGWKMLVGENGVGKSSVLQALALALLANEGGLDAIKSLESLCNLRDSLAHLAREGSIEVWLDDRPDLPITLRFNASEVTLSGGSFIRKPHYAGSFRAAVKPAAVMFVRGYGASRLLPPRAKRGLVATALPTDQPKEVRNLFDPYFHLIDPDVWLAGLGDEERHMAFISLKEMLDLPATSQLSFQSWRGRDTLGFVHLPSPRVSLGDAAAVEPASGHRFTPLEHFSAGYQSIVALGCDIMAGFGRMPGDMQKRAGIILLDEIGTNLHPRWRLRIVEALRRAFPRLQFIASTHEPLCLRGLSQPEVALLELDDDSHSVLVRDEDLPEPSTFRVDQLLTSEFFGLNTTYDPDEEAAFDAYHSLLIEERRCLNDGRDVPGKLAGRLDILRRITTSRLRLGGTLSESLALDKIEVEERGHEDPAAARRLKQDPAASKAATERLLKRLQLAQG